MVKEEWINEQNRGRKEGKIWLKQDSQGPFLDHYWMSVRTVPEQAQPLNHVTVRSSESKQNWNCMCYLNVSKSLCTLISLYRIFILCAIKQEWKIWWMAWWHKTVREFSSSSAVFWKGKNRRGREKCLYEATTTFLGPLWVHTIVSAYFIYCIIRQHLDRNISV